MNVRKQFRYFLSLALSLAIIWTIGFTQVVNAANILPGGNLASSDVLNNDLFILNQQVTIDGTVNGDVFAVGNTVKVNGTVNGSLFVVGQQVAIAGKVSGTTYVAAVALTLEPTAVLQRNLYFIGLSLEALPGSTIQRDLLTFTLGATLNGTISGNTNATIGLLNLVKIIVGALGGSFQIPVLGAPPTSMIPAGVGAGLLASPLAAFLPAAPTPTPTDTTPWITWLLAWVREFAVLLVLGAICYWLLHKPLDSASQALRANPLLGLGAGLLWLLLVINIFLAVALLAVLVLVLGFWLGTLGVWIFALSFMALTLASLAFFSVGLFFLVSYGTKLVVAYMVAAWLFEKIIPKVAVPAYVSLAVGLLIYVLLHSIPTLGWVVGVLVTAWGLGAFWLAYRRDVV